tara:strand:- start:123 stop:251 length:129 start_codon:yes stop_codon:yes gene_type:complete
LKQERKDNLDVTRTKKQREAQNDAKLRATPSEIERLRAKFNI